MEESQKPEEETGEEGNENNDDVGQYLVDLPGGPGEDEASNTPARLNVTGAEVEITRESLAGQIKL